MFVISRRKFCKFTAEGTKEIDYKDLETLKAYVRDEVNVPSRITARYALPATAGNSTKRARYLALIPYVRIAIRSKTEAMRGPAEYADRSQAGHDSGTVVGPDPLVNLSVPVVTAGSAA